MNVSEIVTQKIIEELEKGQIPWHKPWIGTHAIVSRGSGKPYSFINQMLIGRPGEYATFNQITQEGGRLNKGAKGSVVVFYKKQLVEEPGIPEDEQRYIPVLRYYRVFNIEDTNLERKHKPEPITFNPIEEGERVAKEYLTREGIGLIHEYGNKACYNPESDAITLPKPDQFPEEEEYYSTLFHEITHSTGIETRLNRKVAKEYHSNKETRSREELIAEIGAAAMNTHLGISNEKSMTNSAGYIQSWLTYLKNDTKAIITASSQAEKSHNYVLGVTE